MGDLRNILLIALWLGAKGLALSQPAQQQGGVANRPLTISRRVAAPPQQQQQQVQMQGLPGGNTNLPGPPIPQQSGQQQQQGGGQQGGTGASWIGTGTDCTIPVGSQLPGQFDLGYQGGLAGAGGPVTVVSQSPNVVQIIWPANPPVLPGTAGQSLLFTVILSPTSTSPGQEPWSIVIRVATQTSTLSGTITVTGGQLQVPPQQIQQMQQFAQTQRGTPYYGWNRTNVMTLHMRFNWQAGKVRAVKHGIYGPMGFFNVRTTGSVSSRLRLRGYRNY